MPAALCSSAVTSRDLAAAVFDPRRVPDLSEKKFTRCVLKLADALGWMTAHFRPARVTRNGKETWETPIAGNAKGYPDLTLARGPGFATRVVVAELKMPGNDPTPEQYAWLAAFEASGCGVLKAFVWRPGDWDDIVSILRDTR